MPKKILTVDDLLAFCESKDFSHFSSKKTGTKIYVQMPAYFEKMETDDFSLYAWIKIMHEDRNRNGSSVTSNAADHCMAELAYKPLLANFTDVNGEWDFTSHDFIETKDEDGNIIREYQEHQVGCFTVDKPYKKYDEEYEKTYIYGRVCIPKDYTKTVEILERKGGTPVSAELEILELSYNAKEKLLVFDDAIITGVTLLGVRPDTGKEVQPGMVGANISLQDFSKENNSVITDEILAELKKFNKYFETMKDNFKEGGKEDVNKELFEKLLTQYNVSEEDVEFETDGLSDEELTSKFEEVFGQNDNTNDNSNDDNNNDEKETFSVTMPNGTKKTFSLSCSEITTALFNLINDTYSELDNEIYSVEVYPEELNVVFTGWFNGNSYRQGYKKKKDNFSLENERVSVHRIFVSEDEEKLLEKAKADFEDVSNKLNDAMDKISKYESEPEKLEVLSNEDYSPIFELDEYKELSKRENYFNLSKEEISEKLDSILLNYAKQNKGNFAKSDNTNDNTDNANIKKKNFSFVPIISSPTGKKSRYGNLFNRD